MRQATLAWGVVGLAWLTPVIWVLLAGLVVDAELAGEGTGVMWVPVGRVGDAVVAEGVGVVAVAVNFFLRASGPACGFDPV